MSSNTGYIMTLANSIIGVGILAMPFCFQKCGILLSILLLVISNLVTRLACYYLMKTSIKARRKNLEFIASYVFGSSGKLMAELCIIGYLMGTCITYFVVVGDLGPQIVAKSFNINHSDSLRTFTMIIVTIFCIIPLSLLRNIESLSVICISSILFYFCLVLKIFFESETKIVSSYWYEKVYWWRPSGVTQCLPIFSMALSCQMQIFEIYESLPSQTLEKMNHIVKYGTGICTIVYVCVGFFGYVAFYDQPFTGNVLLSLTPSLASDVIQMGFVLSVAVSFPLVIFPCRASLYSLLYHRSHSETAHYIPEHRFKYITISMVLVALIVGILIPSIELIIGLVGSTIGVSICIMFPASCFIKTNKKNSTERLTAQFLVVFGFFVMILGTYANLGAIDEQQSGATIPIDRLPDIHVTHSTENIFMPPSKLDNPKKQIENEPNKLIDTVYSASAKTKHSKRKLIKSTLPRESAEIVREINLIEKDKQEMQQNHVENVVNEPTALKMNENPPSQSSNLNNKSAAQPKPNILHPTIMKKSADSVINNDAIQKEEQEIKINAIDDVKRTQEIVDAVKNQLSKQNEENQRAVMQKINEISEKMNSIAQSQNDERIVPKSNSAKLNASAAIAVNKSFERNSQAEPVIPPIPLPKLLVGKSSSLPTQLNEIKATDSIVGSKMDKPTVQEEVAEVVKNLPLKPDQTNEKVGRDILSHDQAIQKNMYESSRDKSET